MDQPLTLKQLVQIVPLDEKIKERAINEEKELGSEQKYEISKICWALLSTIFEERMRQKTQEMLKDMADGVKEYEPEDFKKIEDEVLADILIQLDSVKSEKELADIKSQIKATISKKQ